MITVFALYVGGGSVRLRADEAGGKRETANKRIVRSAPTPIRTLILLTTVFVVNTFPVSTLSALASLLRSRLITQPPSTREKFSIVTELGSLNTNVAVANTGRATLRARNACSA